MWRRFLGKPARPAKRVSPSPSNTELTPNLEANVHALEEQYRNCIDFVVRPFRIGGRRNAALLYL
ncbi:MAG: hypothetical protein L5657_04015, partial [Calditerricola sp.]|nr:hypothetical protein [Calditerricola sp.]